MKQEQPQIKPKKQLKLTSKVFNPEMPIIPKIPTNFEFKEEQQVDQIEWIDKLTSIIEIQPLLPIVRIPKAITKTSLMKLIDQEDNQKEIKHLKFRSEDVSYLFTLLLNETKSKMKEIKDSYESENEYLSYMIPPFINETLAYIKSTAEDQMKKYGNPSFPIPLRYQVKVDRQNTILGKYLVLEAVEGDFDQEKGYTWKNTCFSEFYEYQSARSYIVQLIINSNSGNIGLLGIIQRREQSKKHLIYLPWSSRVINAIKIPNIVGDNHKYQKLKESYIPYGYPNFDELFPHEFLVHLNPIFSPATYLIELKGLLNISNSKFLPCILKPQNYIEPNPISKYSFAFGQPLLKITEQYLNNSKQFNYSQKQAIIHATNYLHSFTIINGPPGTGKTYTSLGIMSIILERMDELNEDSIILACGHSNTVINDWIRKLKNGLTGVDGKLRECKVLRIGVADKCDSDIYDNCLEIISQRQFFKEFAPEYEKKSICEIIPSKQKYDQLTLIHVKQKIQSLNDRIYDLMDIYNDLEDQQRFNIDQELIRMNAQKKELRRIYATLVQILGAKKDIYKKLLNDNLDGVKIVVSTLTSSSSQLLSSYLEDKYISILIVDEAPMCFEPSILIPLAKHNIYKLVLLGDHRQLGPVIYDVSNTTYFKYNTSLYERFMNATNQSIMLNIQYRSMKNLSYVTSQFFYQGQVKDDISVQTMDFPLYLKDLIAQHRNFLFFNVHEGEQTFHKTKNSYYNEYEAFGIYFLITHLLKKQQLNTKPTISIITPYRAQVKYIKEVIYKYNAALMDLVEVHTIDAFQGKENDIMIISLVRSEGIGFLSDYRRANVATSRAQYGQFIFGNSNALLNEIHFWSHLYQYFIENNLICEYSTEELQYQDEYFRNALL